MLTINTTRFGELEIEEKRVIHFPEGLIGFPGQKKFVFFEHKPGSPFGWLQSVENGDLAFVTIDPFLIEQDYLGDLTKEERALMQPDPSGKALVFALVTIPPGNPEKMTANLLGPLVIDTESRQGRQVILANSGYNPRHPIPLN